MQVCVDAAGSAQATTHALPCLGRFGRITLLGCTRPHGEYDLYHLVHGRLIKENFPIGVLFNWNLIDG